MQSSVEEVMVVTNTRAKIEVTVVANVLPEEGYIDAADQRFERVRGAVSEVVRTKIELLTTSARRALANIGSSIRRTVTEDDLSFHAPVMLRELALDIVKELRGKGAPMVTTVTVKPVTPVDVGHGSYAVRVNASGVGLMGGGS